MTPDINHVPSAVHYPNIINHAGHRISLPRCHHRTCTFAIRYRAADMLLSRWLTRYCSQTLQRLRSRICLLQNSHGRLLDQRTLLFHWFKCRRPPGLYRLYLEEHYMPSVLSKRLVPFVPHWDASENCSHTFWRSRSDPLQ